AERVTDRRDVHAIGVARVDHQVADLLRVVESQMLPAGAAIGGAIDARAIRDILARLRFARADVDHAGIRHRDGDRADGGNVRLAVRDVAPRLSAVRGSPHATVHRAEVEYQRPGGIARDGDGASAAKRADETPLERLESRRHPRGIGVDARVVRGIEQGWRRRFLSGTRIALRAQERTTEDTEDTEEGCKYSSGLFHLRGGWVD